MAVEEFSQESPELFHSEPSVEMRGVARRIWDKFGAAKQHKKLHDKDWPRWYLLYAGRHWDGRQADWQATPTINMTFSVIETIVPILTDSRPQIYVLPRKFEHERASMMLQDLMEYLWEANNMDILLPKTCRNTLIFGNGFLKVLYNPSLREGQGDIQIVPVDPANIFISPWARTLEEADYVIHAENLPKSLVERIYGVKIGKQSGPDEPGLTIKRHVTSQQSPGMGGGMDYVRATDGSNTYQMYQSGGSDDSSEDDQLVTVIEYWERDGASPVTQTVVVNDEVIVPPHKPFSHSRIPLVHFMDHPSTWSVWAMGEVQQVEKLQIEINRRRGHLLDILKYSANPMLIVDPAAGDFENIISRPGLVLPVEGGPAGAGWLQPPQIPSALLELNMVDKQDFDNILGNVDVLRGQRPAGIEAGVAIDALHEAANVRMRLKARNIENAIKNLGELLCLFVQDFYTTEMIVRVVGDRAMDSGVPLSNDHFLKLNEVVGVNPESGENVVNPETVIPPVIDAQFDVRVGAGSTLPVSRSSQFQKAITLYQMQLVDDMEVLKSSGLPHWDEVLQRSRQYWAQKQAEMMAMQAGQAGAPAEEPGMSDDDLMMKLGEVGGPPPEA